MLIDSWLMQARDNRPSVDSVSTLKHFFPMNETGGTTITDSKGGVIITPTEISFGTNTVRPHEPLAAHGTNPNIPAIPLTSGSWDDMGTNSFCLLAVAELDEESTADSSGNKGGGVTFGDRKVAADVLPKTQVNISTTNAEVAGGLNVIGETSDDHYTARPTRGGVTDGVDGNIFMLDLRVERTTTPGTVRYERWDETASSAEDESISQPDAGGTSIEAATACTPEAFAKIRGLKLYGIALFKFSGAIPANYEQGAEWMSWAWQQGYKTIWPNAVEWV